MLKKKSCVTCSIYGINVKVYISPGSSRISQEIPLISLHTIQKWHSFILRMVLLRRVDGEEAKRLLHPPE